MVAEAFEPKNNDVIELMRLPVRSEALEAVENRFIARLRSGRRCHIHDTGSLARGLPRGTELYFSPVMGLGRETDCDVVAVRLETVVLLDSRLPNALLERALRSGLLPGLGGEILKEQLIRLPGLSYRADFVLARPGGGLTVIEAKGVNYVDDRGYGLFPNAKTERGSRQLDEMRRLSLIDKNIKAVLAFVVLRDDARGVRPFVSVDRAFASRLCAYRGEIEYRAMKVSSRVSDGELRISFAGEIGVEPCLS